MQRRNLAVDFILLYIILVYNIYIYIIVIYKNKESAVFIGRTDEIEKLETLYSSDDFQMPVIYGRRRVGKTRLITEFIRDKRAIYVQARRTNAQTNLRMLSQAVLSFSTGSPSGMFSTYDDLFDAVFELSRDERLVFVIDEFPYLAQSFPEISSLLQDAIDHRFKDESKLMLILCGSSLSFMEEQVLGYESPLYGRRTAQFKIEPFDYFTANRYWEDAAPEDAAIYYGITGGVPAYMEKISASDGVKSNIEALYLTPSGYLFEEPGNLLLQECKNPDQYDSIIQAIASGRSRLSEIATTAQIPESNTRSYLAKLESLGIVARETPFGETGRRRSIYHLIDPMFTFWYKFIPEHIGLIQNNMADAAYERIEARMGDFMGSVFETICTQYVYRSARAKAFPVTPARLGRWWGTDPRTKSQEEIDIVIEDGMNTACFVECKWKNEPVGANVLATLVRRSELFHYDSKHYALMSKRGFTEGCRAKAEEMGNVMLVALEDME